MTFVDHSMQMTWEVIVSSVVKDRVSKVSPLEMKIDLFINFESHKKSLDVLRNIFLIQANEALDELVFKKEVSPMS